MARTSAVLLADARSGAGQWADWMRAEGLGLDGKVYLAYVEGVPTGGLCGLDVGPQARVFTHGCFPDISGQIPNVTGTWTTLSAARTGLHELLHALGAVASCAPGYGGGSHVAELADVMYSSQLLNGTTGAIVPGRMEVLDPQRDDYWGQGAGRTCPNGAAWPDVSLSPYLDAPS